MKTTVAILAVAGVAFLASLAAFVVLTLNHANTSALVSFLGGACITLIPQIATLLKAHSADQGVTQVQKDVDTVIQRTNGPMDNMREQITLISNTVADISRRMTVLEDGGSNARST